jgi:hypothetical protein
MLKTWWVALWAIIAVHVVALWQFDLVKVLFKDDPTHIVAVIMATFFGALLYLGWSLYKRRRDHSRLWFVSNLLMGLGLLGTVAGSIVMFQGLAAAAGDPSQAFKLMAVGLGTAQYATLLGIGYSILLQVLLRFVANSKED